jgi:hypothetical protein
MFGRLEQAGDPRSNEIRSFSMRLRHSFNRSAREITHVPGAVDL